MFFVDALVVLHNNLDSREKRAVQRPSLSNYYLAIKGKIDPFASGSFVVYEDQSVRDRVVLGSQLIRAQEQYVDQMQEMIEEKKFVSRAIYTA